MKKILAILLTLIFTFSCFAVTVFAEEQTTQKVVVTSDFANKNIGNWNTKKGDTDLNWGEEGSVKIPADEKSFLLSELFNITPGNDYAISFEFKVPTSFMVDDVPNGPHFSVFMPAKKLIHVP